jgi:hypothetical protein
MDTQIREKSGKNPLNLELFTTLYISNKVKVNLLIGLIDVPYIHKSIPVYLSNLYLADASTFFCWWLLMIWVSHQMNGSYKSLVKKNWSRYISTNLLLQQ